MKTIQLLFMFLMSHFALMGNVAIINGLTHQHSSLPGERIQGTIELKNSGDDPARILVYQSDIYQDCENNTIYNPINSHPRSSGSWTVVNTTEYTLAPGEVYAIRYEIEVPENQELNGSYWSVIMVEVAKPINEEVTDFGVKLDSKIRYGVQLISTIGDLANSDIDFSDISLDENQGVYYIDAVITNYGEFLVSPTLVLDLYDEVGEEAGRREVKFKKVYPESCKSYRIYLDGIPNGNYSGVLVADYGQDLFAASLDLQLDK